MTERIETDERTERWRRPSEVFAVRLREMRNERGRTLEQLAARVNEMGVPMTKTAVLRIEKGERGISLDEAVAFAAALNVVFASLLSPPEGEVIAVTDKMAMNGERFREWLRYGLWDWQPAPDEAHDEGRANFHRSRLAALARAMAEAHDAQDWGGVTYLDEQIRQEVKRRERELAQQTQEASDAS